MPAARVRGRPRAWLTAIAALAVLLIVSDAQNSSGASTSAQACASPSSPPAPVVAMTSPPPASVEPAPEQILVCAGSESITGASYSHWATVARMSEGRHHQPSAAETRNQVLSFLISGDWVKDEARDLHIGVSAAQVKRQFDRVKAQQFRRRAEFEAFLRSSGETVADLLFRVQLNMLSERLERHVSAVPGGPRAQQRALSRFVETFHAKWSSQTYCVTGYVVQDCGHVQSVV